MNKEAWRLALSLIPSLNIYDSFHDAEFVLLSAEVYLANKKAIKAFELLKCEFIFYIFDFILYFLQILIYIYISTEKNILIIKIKI